MLIVVPLYTVLNLKIALSTGLNSVNTKMISVKCQINTPSSGRIPNKVDGNITF